MNKKIKILFISHSSGLAGAERSLLLLLKYINRKLFEPIVILPRPGPFKKELDKLNIKTYFVHCPEWVRKRIDVPSFFYCSFTEIIALIKLVNIIIKEKIDLIYTNVMVLFSGAIISKITKIPHIWHIREFVPEEGGLRFFFSYKKLFYFVSYFSEALNTNSYSLAEHFKSFQPKAKLNVIYTPVEINDFKISEKLKVKGVSDKDFIIACIGSLQKRKAQDDAIKAISIAKKHIPNIKLLIVGEGTEKYKNYLKELTLNLNVKDKVIFVGFRKDISPILSKSKILLMPSWKEPYGRVVLEAMAFGIPVIGVNSGGTKEQIVDGITGFLVPPKNSEKIAERIIYLYKNPKIAKKISKNALEQVKKENNPKNYAKKIEKIILKTLFK